MGAFKEFIGLQKLPEVIELKKILKSNKFLLGDCSDFGLVLYKKNTEIRLIPEEDRLHVLISDDGFGDIETFETIGIIKPLLEKHGYRQGIEKTGDNFLESESENEFYKEIVTVLNASTDYIPTKQELDRLNRNMQKSIYGPSRKKL